MDVYRHAFKTRRQLVHLRDSYEQAGSETTAYQTACIHIRSRCMFLLLHVNSAVQSEEAFIPLSLSTKKQGSTTHEDMQSSTETPLAFDDQEQARKSGSPIESLKKISMPVRMLSVTDNGRFKDDGGVFPSGTVKAVSCESQESKEGESAHLLLYVVQILENYSRFAFAMGESKLVKQGDKW